MHSQFILQKIDQEITMNKPAGILQFSKNIEINTPTNLLESENGVTYKNNNNSEEIIDVKIYSNTQLRRKRQSPPFNSKIPPRPFFQRNRSQENSFRIGNRKKSNQAENRIELSKSKETHCRVGDTLKITELRKRLSLEIEQKEKLKQNIADKDAKISTLNQQMIKLKQQIKWYHQQLQKSSQITQEKEREFIQAQLIIQSLNKAINSNKNYTKKQVKQIQSKEDNLLQKLQKLIEENAELAKKISEYKLYNNGKKTQLTEEDKQINKETIYSLQLQVNRLNKQLQKNKSERQRHLQGILREVQSKLYEKQNDLRKSSMHINLLGRKHTISIDEVRHKKDQEIRYLRQKFLKASKDLKQTKNKIDKNVKKKVDKELPLNKIKSYKDIKFGSDTDDFTFELSSEV